MIVSAPDFAAWRTAARVLLAAGVPPADVLFDDGNAPGLFAADELPAAPEGGAFRVPRAFVALAESVACHRDPRRWGHLYRALWRLTHGEPHLLDLATDDDVGWLLHAEKSVRRDVHKMHAFVRFRAVGEHFVAWHRPDHRILRRASPFFARRFPEMRWSILTPDESVLWDGEGLQFGPGVPAKDAPAADELEGLWKTYYRATFNPARIKVRAMKKELPVRHWATLPEAAIIPDLLAEAPARVAEMVAHQEGCARSAADFLPAARDLDGLRAAARGCSACGLCGPGSPPAFGEGPAGARVVLVGDRPLAGAAGALLDAALDEAGLDRAAVYRTQAVKRAAGDGPRVGPREAASCRPWLLAELAAIRPAAVVCLGPAAARAVLGPLFRFAERRGEVVAAAGGANVVATLHPAAALRAGKRAELIAHLALARGLAERPPGTPEGPRPASLD
ncbi:Uracil DNA glycosylase superfamily protein [Aquisphaera giovannonii]|uniref:Uracil DNA glycosylase superfamily protein n=1 Tax=Aquisphaera giovannonii TaxID=406548 RepID=A0A5B9W4V9_9BACT|nr:TIGR03915 family putative DNA repair protein [Aquisphaera giovannonii]QEH35622.1 Uracil DNA glycosylase superfamily protein [Aquisphaera giovannonii]